MSRRPLPLSTIGSTFLRLGATSFGGPAAGLLTLEQELTHRLGWLPETRFRELLTWAKMLPGPATTQLSILAGRALGGTPAGLIAGLAFITPALLCVLALSALGRHWAEFPMAPRILQGLTASALAVVVTSIYDLIRGQAPSRSVATAMSLSTLLCFQFPRMEPILILLAGLWSARATATDRAPSKRASQEVSWPILITMLITVALVLASFDPPSLGLPSWSSMALIAYRSATLTFGTGMAILPILFSEFVEKHHWVTTEEFTQGLAIGQITPGPIVTTATALGFSHYGWVGAAACTFGIFLPSFLNTLILVPAAEQRVGDKAQIAAFVRGAMPWILGSILAAALKLAAPLVKTENRLGLCIFAITSALSWLQTKGRRPPPWLLIPAGGILAFLLSHLF